MEARAKARYIRVTPRKARRVVDLIRGLPAQEAQAVRSERIDPQTLRVSGAWVDEGPTLKRFRPRAQGRGYRINKRTSHITVIVSDERKGETKGRTH